LIYYELDYQPPVKHLNLPQNAFVHGCPPKRVSPLDFRAQARKLVRKSIRSQNARYGSLLSQNSSDNSSFAFVNRTNESHLSALGINAVTVPKLVLSFNASKSVNSFRGVRVS